MAMMNQFTYVLDTRITRMQLQELVYHMNDWITSPNRKTELSDLWIIEGDLKGETDSYENYVTVILTYNKVKPDTSDYVYITFEIPLICGEIGKLEAQILSNYVEV